MEKHTETRVRESYQQHVGPQHKCKVRPSSTFQFSGFLERPSEYTPTVNTYSNRSKYGVPVEIEDSQTLDFVIESCNDGVYLNPKKTFSPHT